MIADAFKPDDTASIRIAVKRVGRVRIEEPRRKLKTSALAVKKA